MSCPWCCTEQDVPTCVDVDPEHQNVVEVIDELTEAGFKVVCIEVGQTVRWEHGFLWNTEADFYRVWIKPGQKNLI